MIRGSEDKVVLGKQLFHGRLKKARSSLTKVGADRLLDQVKRLSSSGSSSRANSLIMLLKASASGW